jgi:hypothetical protein
MLTCEANYKTHTLKKPADCNCAGTIHEGRCNICDHGLAFCVVCKGGEVELEQQSCAERLASQAEIHLAASRAAGRSRCNQRAFRSNTNGDSQMAKAKTKPKYTTLTELAAAFKSGELDSSYTIVIDKGGCSLHLRQDGPEETELERSDHCQSLFNREYSDPLEELLGLAGIPAEWC